MSRRSPYKTARCVLYREHEYLLAVLVIGGTIADPVVGQIEWGESPDVAVRRELEEELSVYVPDLIEIGAFHYKKALHMVYAAELTEPISDWDDSELLDIRWFHEDAVQSLADENALHAAYELDAIRALKQKLGR